MIAVHVIFVDCVMARETAMKKRTCSTHCILCALLSVFLALASLFFLATLGLGTYAIVNAGTFAEYCVDSDPATPCAFAANASSVNVAGSQYPYWLAGASGAAVMYSLLATISLCVAVELLKKRQLERRKKSVLFKDWNELKELAKADAPAEVAETTSEGGAAVQGEVADASNENEDAMDTEGADAVHRRNVRVSIDIIGGEEVKEWQETTVRSFTLLAGVVLFFGILAAMCALLCMLWGIAISFNQYSPRLLESVIGSAYNCTTLIGPCVLNNSTTTNNNTIKATNYIIVDILIGIVAPILLFISTGLVATVVDFITVGQLDMRNAISYILSSVALQEGKENNYWTILDTFFFPMNKRPHRSDHGLLYSCDKSGYTWCFAIICALSILLVFSYFVDLTVTDEITSKSCPSNPGYVCFYQENYTYVDCSLQVTKPLDNAIICYKFLRFGVDVNLITALSQSFAFYLLITTFFTQVFTVVRVLISIKPSRFWGIGLILFSFLLIGGAIAVLVNSDVLVAYTGILSILEFFMVAAAVFVIGILLVEGKWWEKLSSNGAQKVHFVHYSNTSRRKLEEIHHAVALEEEEGIELEHEHIASVHN